MPKFIFVTGGVVSSLGKGLTSASIGLLLERRGLKIKMQKIDPYLNVDPGTMSPFQHGEVYVTEDGAETDLDLGHYERFTKCKLTKASNFTTGRVYYNIINKERRGDYLGKTVQVVPHVTDEIKRLIRSVVESDDDIVISELGGTVGDIEGLHFLEAIRQLRLEEPPCSCINIHLTLLPYLKASGELKTKPTQHSVGKLREIGIQPDIIICRTQVSMPAEHRDKISLFCNVRKDAVFEEKDVDYSIYEVPLLLYRQKIDEMIAKLLNIDVPEPGLDDWREMIETTKSPAAMCRIAVAGKYVQLRDAYKSIYESLAHAGIANNAHVEIKRVSSEDIERIGAEANLHDADGVLVPGGFGERGIEGKVSAARYARENKLPYFGICLGMQVAVIEFARNVCGIEKAHSTEFDKTTPDPIISLLEEQKEFLGKKMGGTMRLGAYPCTLAEGTKARAAYDTQEVNERHRHRYEFNNSYRDAVTSKGLVLSGLSPVRDLVEIVEVADHPWFVAVQFHPEFKSKPTAAHPLFRDFVAAAIARRKASERV
jgi:CTP synthase